MKTLIVSLKIFAAMTLLTGVAYPVLITVFAQSVFPWKANGSLIKDGNKIVGSTLIAQAFDSCIYFKPRPSSINYDASCSGASNLSATSAKLQQQVKERRLAFIADNALDSTAQVPSEMLYASGSGLDPHISVESALLQVNRVASSREMGDDEKQRLVQLIISNAHGTTVGQRQSGWVNVLELNVALSQSRIGAH